jgi:hypothetical protein
VRLVRGFAYQGVQSFRPEVFPEQVHQ